MTSRSPNRVVLACGGGPETSAIGWLSDTSGAEVVAVTMDLGQGLALEDIRERALAQGAVRAHVLDLRDSFARGHLLPALQAGALQDGDRPLVSALGRPLMALHLVQLARLENADAVAHGSSSTDLDTLVHALEPALQVMAPARAGGFSPVDLLEPARTAGTDAPADDSRPQPRSAQGLLGDPAHVDIEFERGVPVRTNGVAMSLVELIQSLETIGRAHGVESPATGALHAAHRELQAAVAPPHLPQMAALAAAYVTLIDHGGWFTPARDALDAQVATGLDRLTGTIRVRFRQGECRVVGCRSPFAAMTVS
ncbi:MAG TPA: argininosuccinate synthase domain-containing protein [Vicinamibacterales bacterium]|nr:argininosuccinate synthase domain-containing protein [Vicinamibacterales bacterium]